jgi:hypothetical protein
VIVGRLPGVAETDSVKVHSIRILRHDSPRHDSLGLDDGAGLLIPDALPGLDNSLTHAIPGLWHGQAGGDVVENDLVVLGRLGRGTHEDMAGDLGQMALNVREEDGMVVVRLDVAQLGGQVVDVDAMGRVFDEHGIVGWGALGMWATCGCGC